MLLQKLSCVNIYLLIVPCEHCKYADCVNCKYALFQKCVKIASSIMPGVKILRQNFVSASNKSPKDKRLKMLNLSEFLEITNILF